jgi:DNA-binding IclR family transcriptional regulator
MMQQPVAGPRRNASGLVRDLEILELLSAPEAMPGGLGVLRVAELTGRDKAVISRSLATLADSGLLSRDATTLTYRLGSRLYALAARTAESTLVREARPYLRKIARHTRETTHLSVLRGDNVLTLISELSPYEVRTAAWEGVTTAAWRTPSGRVLISDWDNATLGDWYAEHGHDRALVDPVPVVAAARFTVLDPPQPGTSCIQDLVGMHAELGRIRRQGFALSDEELETGVVAASAPVLDFTGRVVAAVNISAPKARVGDRLDKLGIYVAQAAIPLSRHLGATEGQLACLRDSIAGRTEPLLE